MTAPPDVALGLRALGFEGGIPSPAEQAANPRLQEIRRGMLRTCLPYYAAELLRGIEAEGGTFSVGPHHVEWGKMVRQHRRIVVQAARDHGKSWYWSMAYPIWMADVVAPGRLGYVFGSTGGPNGTAREILNRIRQQIVGGGEFGQEPNPRLAHLLPFQVQNDFNLVMANGSEIRARGVDTASRGGHPYWVVLDDILTNDHMWSAAARRHVEEIVLSGIEPMVVPDGQLVDVGTPMHVKDVHAVLEGTGIYHVSKFPALDPQGRPLWPQRYDLEALDRKKRSLASSIRWAREFMCQPLTDDATLFPSWLFEVPGVKLPYALGLGADYWDAKGFPRYMGVDLALSASAGGDWLVAYILALAPNGDRYPVDIVRRKGLGYQQQVDLLAMLNRRYRCSLIFIEANQYQRVISDMVIDQTDLPVRAFYTAGRDVKAATQERRGIQGVYSANKNALDHGVPGIRMLFENGKWKIPWHADPATREAIMEWLGELQAFGWADGKMQGIGEHDDIVMASWMADRAAVVGSGIGFSFGDSPQPPAAGTWSPGR